MHPFPMKLCQSKQLFEYCGQDITPISIQLQDTVEIK